MNNQRRCAAFSLLLALCIGRVGAQEMSPTIIPLVFFPDAAQEFSAWMRAGGWQSKRNVPRGWEADGDGLRLRSDDNSVLIATKKGFPLDINRTPILHLRLRVLDVPRGTDLSRKSGDDAALRVYAAFDRGGGMFTPPNTIGYTWTEKDDAGTLIASAHFSNLHYISLGKGPTPGDEWVVVERDLAADYRLAFPGDRDLPRLGGLGLKCDANDTRTSAEALLSAVEVRSN